MGLRRGTRIYFDTNVVIRLIERKDAVVRSILEAIRGADNVIVTSELTLAEALVVPIAVGNANAIRAYEAFVSTGDGVMVVHVDRNVLYRTAALRAEFKRLKTPDAIHVASALDAECDVVVSGDLLLHTPQGLPVILPENFPGSSFAP